MAEIDRQAPLAPEARAVQVKTFRHRVGCLGETGAMRVYYSMQFWSPDGILAYYVPYKTNPRHQLLEDSSGAELPYGADQSLDLDPSYAVYLQLTQDDAMAWDPRRPKEVIFLSLKNPSNFELLARINHPYQIYLSTREQIRTLGVDIQGTAPDDRFITAARVSPVGIDVKTMVSVNPVPVRADFDAEEFLRVQSELPVLEAALSEPKRTKLKGVLEFFNWYKNKCNASNKDKLKRVISEFEKKRMLSSFLNAFQLCSDGNEDFGDHLLEIAGRQPDGLGVFQLYQGIQSCEGELKTIRSDALKNPDLSMANAIASMDLKVFSKSIERKSKEMMKKAAQGTDLNTLIEEFDPYRILWGACFKAIYRGDRPLNELPQTLEIALGAAQVQVLQNQAEAFTENDRKQLFTWLDQSYGLIDPAWLGVLKRKLDEDLRDPHVRMVLVRQDERLIGIAKIKKIGDKRYYFGTHYVDPHYSSAFDLGRFVQELVCDSIEDDAVIEASIALANPSLERHINDAGMIGTSLTLEADSEGTSDLLVQVSVKPKGPYRTKNKTQYPNEQFKELLNGETAHHESDMSAYLVDSRPGHDQEYRNILDREFKAAKSLTRVFYEKNQENHSDLSKTYLVFESPKDPN